MVARTESLFRRAFSAQAPHAAGFTAAPPAEVFTQGFLNASLLQLAICAPPRQAERTPELTKIYITEPGAIATVRAATAQRAAR